MKFLVKRAQRGDDQAFVELIEENKQAMYKVAVGILKNDFDAADAIQQSILTCYEKLKELKKAQYFKTWLLRILINNCNQMLREQKIQKERKQKKRLQHLREQQQSMKTFWSC